MPIVNFENYKGENKKEMSKDDKIIFQKKKAPSNMTTHYVIMPENTKILMNDGKKTSDVRMYWKINNISNVIKDNFEFDDKMWYNIYFLQNAGWRMMNKSSYKGTKFLQDKTLNYILDSNSHYLEDDNDQIYMIEIEEIGLKNA